MLQSLASALLLITAGASAAPQTTSSSSAAAGQWKAYAADLLTESMDFMDPFYDPTAGYLIDTNIDNGFSALYHTTRESVWYAAGLLARNHGDDKVAAAKVISNIISAQFTNTSDQWYGAYQIFPEEPQVGSSVYPADIYNSWDPNWRAFVGTTLVMIVEEFSDLLSAQLVKQIVASVHLAALGDTYRGCLVDGDNFCTCYSNPQIMSAAMAGWAAQRTGDKNLTAYANARAQAIVKLFNQYGTLSEFNSGTYAGVSVFGLTLWAKYFPASSVFGANGGKMLTSIWQTLGSMYNAELKNMAGPWDRTYGYDLTRYVGITALWIWGVVGKDKAPVYTVPADMAHVSDFQFGPLVAVLGPFHNKFLSSSTVKALASFPGTHTVTKQVYSPPYDLAPRNVTTWLSPGLTIGAQSFHENVIGGPSSNPNSFSPAVAQWVRKDNTVGFLTLYSDVYQMSATVKANTLTLSYPTPNATSQFSFFVSPNGLQTPHTVGGWEDIDGINVEVSGSVDPTPAVAYCGANGGTCSPIDLFELWRFTYTMPSGSTETPSITLKITQKE